MSEAQIGTQMSIRALVHVGIMALYSPINRKLGTVRLYQVRPLLLPYQSHNHAYNSVLTTVYRSPWPFGPPSSSDFHSSTRWRAQPGSKASCSTLRSCCSFSLGAFGTSQRIQGPLGSARIPTNALPRPVSRELNVNLFLGACCSGFAWVCMGSMVTDASPSAEALSLINGTLRNLNYLTLRQEWLSSR
jgi:hypothetical protein